MSLLYIKYACVCCNTTSADHVLHEHYRQSGTETSLQTLQQEKVDAEFRHVKLEDIDIIATLGMGGFGRVELVKLIVSFQGVNMGLAVFVCIKEQS